MRRAGSASARRAEDIGAARLRTAGGAAKGATPTVAALHERLLGSLPGGQQERRRVCRLRDVEACGRDCPTKS
jgi:hypothetical protein